MSPARKGMAHHKAKITDDDVREIRRLRAAGLSYTQVTDAIGWKIDVSTVRFIIKGLTWRHVK